MRPDLNTVLWFLAGFAGSTAAAVVAISGRFDRWPVAVEVLVVVGLGGLTMVAFAPWKQILRGSVDRREIRRLTDRLRKQDRNREPLRGLLAAEGDADVVELRRAIHDALSHAAADRMEARRLRRTMHDSIRKETDKATGRLQREAATDPLTRVGNRRAMQEQLGPMLARARGEGRSLTALVIDVDRFKRINDELGHGVGDECLVILGRLLGECLRDDDRAYRNGGDEFVVLMPGAPGEMGRKVAKRLSSLYAQTAWPHIQPTRPTLSIGVATLAPRDAGGGDELIRQADMAMYAAKRQGRGRVMGTNEIKGAA